MSHTFGVLDLERDGETSMTQQLVDHIARLIDSGELEPGAKLPATRALAADAHINHLTAVRVYRRLAELGYVTAAVGRGTFVRRNVPAAAAGAAGAIDDDWQLGMLAPRTLSYADEMLRDSLHAPHASDTIALGSGFPDPALCPSQELAEIAADIARETPRAVTDYLQVEGLPRAARAPRRARPRRRLRAAAPTRSSSPPARARRSTSSRARSLGPGDVAVIESPTFAGSLASLKATGARVLPLPVDDEGPDIDALERILARHEIKLVVLQASCANPTGADLSPRRRDKLVELARTRGFFVLDDGVYATIRYEGAAAAGACASARRRTSSTSTRSRRRSAAACASAGSRRAGRSSSRLVQLKLDSDIHTAALPQHLGARYLRGDRHERLLAKAIPVYRDRRDALLRALERHLGHDATWTMPAGGHNTWVTLRDPVDERALYVEALREGVSFLPGGAIQAEKSIAHEHAPVVRPRRARAARRGACGAWPSRCARCAATQAHGRRWQRRAEPGRGACQMGAGAGLRAATWAMGADRA